MARPRKQTAEQRPTVVSVRLSAAERATFEGRVAAAGVTPAEYSRQALLTGRVTISRTAQADPALIVQLVRIGTNLNQLTRTANGTGRVPDNLDQLCRKVREIVMRAVGEEEAA